MTNGTTIPNLALGVLGIDATITSIDAPMTDLEQTAASAYLLARRELLAMRSWRFATTRAELVEIENTSSSWAHAYELPAACVTPRGIVTLSAVDAARLYPRHPEVGGDVEPMSLEFEVDGAVLRTNQAGAFLLFTTDVKDPELYSTEFLSALAVLCAARLAPLLLNPPTGERTAGELLQLAFGADGTSGFAGKAAEVDASHVLKLPHLSAPASA